MCSRLCGGGLLDYTVSFLGQVIAIVISRPRSLTIFQLVLLTILSVKQRGLCIASSRPAASMLQPCFLSLLCVHWVLVSLPSMARTVGRMGLMVLHDFEVETSFLRIIDLIIEAIDDVVPVRHILFK